MERIPMARPTKRGPIIGAILVFMLLIAACGGDSTATDQTNSASPTTPATQTTSPQPTTPPATPAPTQSSVSPSSTSEPAVSLPPDLTVLTPEDGAGVEVDAVRVSGITSIDAVVGVNGTPVEVSADGSFQYDLDLETGANIIEVVATNLSGKTASQEIAVFFISTAAGLPFTLFYPPDGLVVSEPEIQVIGGTRPEAVVGVNGIPVDTNGLGIFSTSVTLEEGGNFIEVLATDIDGSVRFQTVAVFYIP